MKRYCPCCGRAIHAQFIECSRCNGERGEDLTEVSLTEQLSEVLGFRVHVEQVRGTPLA